MTFDDRSFGCLKSHEVILAFSMSREYLAVNPSGPLETLIFFGREPSEKRKAAVRSDGSKGS